MKNTVLISSFLGRGQRWQLVALVALFFAAGCTVELYPPAQEVSNLPDGGKVDVLPDTIPRAFAFGPRIYWSQIVASDSAYSIAVTDANNKGRWLDSLRWVPSGPFVTVNGDTLSTRAYARDNSGVTGDNQVLTYNGSGSLTIESGNTVDMSDLLDNTDAQTIDTLTLQGDTMLQMSLSGDGAPVKELDLSALRSVVDSTRLTQDSILVYYQDGVEIGRDTIGVTDDNQVLTYNGSGSLAIEDGNTVDMSDLLDNTDDQTIDTLSLSGTTLSLSLESDGQAAQTVDFSALAVIDSTRLAQDSILVYYQDGAEVGRDTIAGTGGGGSGTDDQTLTYNGSGSLTIENGNTVDMSDLLDNTDDQTIDTFSLSGTTLSLSLESDGQAAQTVDLSALAVIDSTRLTQDSILVYYQDGVEIGRDTIAGVGGTGGGGADNLGNHIMTQNLQTNGNWISGDGGNEGMQIDSDGNISTSGVTSGYVGNVISGGGDYACSCDEMKMSSTLSINNQALEITIPASIFTGSYSSYFLVTFKVAIAYQVTKTEFFVTATGNNWPSALTYTNYVVSTNETDFSAINYRMGHDGTNLKIWIGELSSSGIAGYVTISDVKLFARTALDVDNVCSSFTASAESTSFDTVVSSGKVTTTYHPLIRHYQKGGGDLGSSSVSGILFADRGAQAGGAMEITIPVTASMTNDVTLTMDVGFSNSSNSIPMRYGTLRTRLNMSTKAWTNATFKFHDSGFVDPDFQIRLGDDGTNLKIWFWSIGSSKSILAGVVIKNVVMNKYGSSLAPIQAFADFINSTNWTNTHESTAYDNVDVVLGPFSGMGINTSSPSYILDINSTDAVRLPVGTTAQNPTGATGLLRYNSDSTAFTGYYNAQWNRLIDYDYLSSSAGQVASNYWVKSGSDLYYNSGNIGIGQTSPTAALHLPAGTATANTSPLKFTSGTNLTTPEAGAMEWDGTNLYITQTTGPTRKTIAYVDTDDGSASDTTDGSGDITVSHTLGSASITVTATATGTTFYHVQVHSKTSTTFKIRFYNSLGPAATSTAVTADWIAKLQ